MATKKQTPAKAPKDLAASVEKLNSTIGKLPDKFNFLRRPWNIFLGGLLRGVGYSIGILIAIAVIIPLSISLLRSVNWVPLVGDFVTEIVERIEIVQEQTTTNGVNKN